MEKAYDEAVNGEEQAQLDCFGKGALYIVLGAFIRFKYLMDLSVS